MLTGIFELDGGAGGGTLALDMRRVLLLRIRPEDEPCRRNHEPLESSRKSSAATRFRSPDSPGPTHAGQPAAQAQVVTSLCACAKSSSRREKTRSASPVPPGTCS